MINYVLSIIYILFFMFSLYFLGNIFFPKRDSLPERIVYTYIVYKFISSLIACIVKLLQLPFSIFCVLMVLLWLGLYGYAFYKKKKENIHFKKRDIKEHGKRYWFTGIIVIVLMFFSLANIQYHWFGNHLDDGYYVNSVADYTHNVDSYKIHPSTGLHQTSKFDFSYTLNTWQIESGFYAKVFHIDAAVFLKFAQSFINYWLMIIIMLAFLEKIFAKKDVKKYKYYLQFIPMATILFVYQFDVLSRLINLISGWQFGNAIYYGSMMVRIAGIFLLLLLFVDKEKISFKDIIIYGIISFVLITQSSVALPVIIIVVVSYLITYLIFNVKNKWWLVGLIGLIIIGGLVLSDLPVINSRPIILFQVNMKSIIFYASIIVLLLGYLYKNKIINKVNTMLLLIFAFMYIPEINDITEHASVFDFVEARFWTGAFYVIMILAFAYAYLFICKRFKKTITVVITCILFITVVLGATLSFHFRYITYGSIPGSYKILSRNPELLPSSTVKLGKELVKIGKEKKSHLYVLTPDWVVTNKYNHSLAVLLRQYSPDISVISAIPRYSGFTDKEFKGFEQKDDDLYKSFMQHDKDNYEAMEKLLEKYPINCLVADRLSVKDSMNSLGFPLEKKVCADKKCYYIYYKKIERN